MSRAFRSERIHSPRWLRSVFLNARAAHWLLRWTALCCALLTSLSTASAEPTLPPPRIGFLLPASGSAARLNEGIRDGALLAREDLRNEKSSDGSAPEIVFIERDPGADPSTVINRLFAAEHVDAIISSDTEVARALKAFANARQILAVGICPCEEAADGKYTFVNTLDVSQAVTRYLSRFRAVFGEHASLGVYALREPRIERIVQTLERTAAKNPAVHFIEYFNRGESDFREAVLAHRTVPPDAFLLLGAPPEIEILARQLHTVFPGYPGNSSIPLTSIESLGTVTDLTAFEGAWFIDAARPSQSFRERFRKSYSREPAPGAAIAFDTVRMLAGAIAEGRTAPQPNVRAAERFRLIKNFPGVLGTLSVNDRGIISSEPSLNEIRSGTISSIE